MNLKIILTQGVTLLLLGCALSMHEFKKRCEKQISRGEKLWRKCLCKVLDKQYLKCKTDVANRTYNFYCEKGYKLQGSQTLRFARKTKTEWDRIIPSCSGKKEPLLIFLIDGVRWDYLQRYEPAELPGFTQLLKGGTKAEYLVPDYLSDSYPNYYTLMTGLYTENHGFVSNYMWDPLYPAESFLIGTNPDQYNSHWWNDAEPFWISAERQGLTVHMWYWLGCEVEIRGLRPTYCNAYQENGSPTREDFRKAINSSITALTNGEADIAAIYYEQVDKDGHFQGTNGVDEAIRNVDGELDRMFRLMEQKGIEDQLNIVMFSDHGMSDFVEGYVIELLNYMNDTDYQLIIPTLTSVQIWPHAGQREWLYNKLAGAHPHLHVYRREDIPERFHHSKHRRISPIFLACDRGWEIRLYFSRFYQGIHGYDNMEEEMRGIIYVYGPQFKDNYTIPGFNAVDVYQILCHVTPVKPLPHNGTWEHVCDMFDGEDVC